MYLDKLIKKYKGSESFFSLALGVLVVIIVGNQIIGFINRKSSNGATSQPNNSIERPVLENLTDETYLVQKGEYLYQIAEKKLGDGNLWPKIAVLNKISNPGVINPGDKLVLPKISNQLLSASTLQEKPSEQITGDKYTVQANDSLWKICIRAYGDGYQWPKVAKANNLRNPDVIDKGQELTIPR